jgi:hypothetical protein
MKPAKKRPNSSSFIIIHVGQVQERKFGNNEKRIVIAWRR